MEITVEGTAYTVADEGEAGHLLRRLARERKARTAAEKAARERALERAWAEAGRLALACLVGNGGRLPDVTDVRNARPTTGGAVLLDLWQRAEAATARFVCAMPTAIAEHADGSVAAVRLADPDGDAAWYAVGVYGGEWTLQPLPAAVVARLEPQKVTP